MTTLELTDELVTHLRELLFGDMHERAETLADKAHAAHETCGPVDGEDAEGLWQSCGMRETAAILDLIGRSTRDDAARRDRRRLARGIDERESTG